MVLAQGRSLDDDAGGAAQVRCNVASTRGGLAPACAETEPGVALPHSVNLWKVVVS